MNWSRPSDVSSEKNFQRSPAWERERPREGLWILVACCPESSTKPRQEQMCWILDLITKLSVLSATLMHRWPGCARVYQALGRQTSMKTRWHVYEYVQCEKSLLLGSILIHTYLLYSTFSHTHTLSHSTVTGRTHTLDLSFWSFLTFLHTHTYTHRHREASFVKISTTKNSKLFPKVDFKCATEVACLHRVSIQSCTGTRPSPKVQSL